MFNETIIGAKAVLNTTTTYIHSELYPRGYDIINAPFKVPEMLWMLLPILVSLVMLEVYFGRYKEEELGWNTAVSNTLLLTFVAIDLFRHTYEPTGATMIESLTTPNSKIIIAIMLFGFAILLLLLNFFHFLPKKIAYIISSVPIINMVALLGIIIVYSENILLGWTTLLASVIIFILTNLILYAFYYLVPSYHSPIHRILTVDDVNSYSEEQLKSKKIKL
jgi:hypothetical protein